MQAFVDCKSLKHVFISENVHRIGAQAFAGCENLTHVEIHHDVEQISEGVFIACKALKTAIVPYISRDMFVDCSSLTDVWVTNDRDYTENDYIHGTAFKNCSALKNIWVVRNNRKKAPSHVVNYYDASE